MDNPICERCGRSFERRNDSANRFCSRRCIPRSFEDRFASKVDRRGPDECWPWLGTRIPEGYGQLWRDGRHQPATNVALELAGRPVPVGMFALHSCDYPPCVNPAHLRPGTTRDNSADMLARGRGPVGLKRGAEHRRRTSDAVASTWASYTPEERLARINVQRRARGLSERVR